MKDQINKYIEIESPLVISNVDSDKIDITLENKKIIIAILYRDQFNTIEFNFFREFNLISPLLKRYNNNYSIDYSRAPLSIKCIEDFRYIILSIDNYFFVFNLLYDNDYQIIKEDIDQQKLTLKFSTEQNFKICIYKYKSLNDFYISVNSNFKLPPLWINNPGLMVDTNEFMNQDVKFADIKSEIKNNEIFVVLKNWIYFSNIFKNKNRGKINLDFFLEKLKFNNICYILQYNNTIPNEKVSTLPLLKMRNGKLFIEDKSVLLDYFNKNGEEGLINFYKEILNLNSSGIYLYPSYFFLPNEEALDKVITKSEHEILVYSRNVKKGLIRINNCIEKTKDMIEKNNIVFLSNVLSDSINQAFYIREISNDLEEEIIIFEEIYKQGFTNFGLYVRSKNINLNKKDLIKIFILIFTVPIFIFDFNVITDFKKNITFKENLINILKIRLSINSLFDNIFIDFKKYGIIPIKSVFKENIIKGFFIGNYLYCGLLDDGLLSNKLYLPEGRWYSLADNLIINGGSTFIYKGKNKFYCLLQKENSIIIYNFSSEINQYLKSKKIKFVIFLKFDLLLNKKTSSEILERILLDKKTIEIYHNIEFKKVKNKITMRYFSESKENIGRYIYFVFVIKQEEVNRIICNNKKIIFNRKDNSIEFNHLNRDNKLDFEIYFS